MAAVAGVVTVILLYLLARKLFRSSMAAVVASGLLSIDLLHVVQSRTTMLDIFVPLFGLAAVLFVVYDRDQIIEGRQRGLLRRPWRLAAGLAAGAAVASKWSGVFYLVLIVALTIIWEVAARHRDAEGRSVRKFLRDEALSILLWLFVVPFAVYAFTYIGRIEGTLLAWPWTPGSWFRALWDRHDYMLDFHRDLTSTHGYQSPAWSWLLLKRPVSYFFETAPNGDYKEVIATGSPFVWWTSILAVFYCAVRWFRTRGPGAPEGIIVGGFITMYAPWLLLGLFSPRSAVFLFYLLPVIPFMCLAVAYVVTTIGNTWEAKAAVGVFAVTAIGLFGFYYPIAANVPLPQKDWDRRIWIFDNCDAAERTPTESTVTSITAGRTEITTTLTTGTESLPPPGWCWI